MRLPLVIGNWKMSQSYADIQNFFQVLKAENFSQNVEVGLAPSFVHFSEVVAHCQGSAILVGSQDCSCHDLGAHTGDVAASMIKELGGDFAIVGHSERRQFHGEDSASVCEKAKKALAASLRPVICLGETLDERNADQTEQIVKKQFLESCQNLGSTNFAIAYEPIWAIGTGQTATPQQAQDVQALLRSFLKDLIGPQEAERVRILYGGSVKPGNAAELIQCEDIDGFLVGGASLKADSFEGIVKAAQLLNAD